MQKTSRRFNEVKRAFQLSKDRGRGRVEVAIGRESMGSLSHSGSKSKKPQNRLHFSKSFTRVSQEFHKSFIRVSQEFHKSSTGFPQEFHKSFTKRKRKR